MQQSYTLLAALLLSCALLSAQATLEWAVPVSERQNGSSNFAPMLEYPRLAVGQAGDIFFSGLAAGGSSSDLYLGEEEMPATGRVHYDYFLGKITSDGRPGWIKRFSGLRSTAFGDSTPPYVLPLASGGVQLISLVRGAVVLGDDTVRTSVPDDIALFVGEVNDAGQISRHALIPWGWQEVDAVAHTANGDLLLAGRFLNFQTLLGDSLLTAASSPAYYVSRLTSDNQISWATTISGEDDWGSVGNAYGLLETRLGDIALTLGPAGRNYTGCGGNLLPMHLVRLDGPTGEVQYVREVARTRFGYLSDLVEAPNGDLYVAGSQGGGVRATNRETAPAADSRNCNVVGGFVLKIDATSGAVQDLAARHESLRGTRVNFLPDNGYLVSGIGRSIGSTGPAGAVVSRYDKEGQLLSSAQITDYETYRKNWVTTVVAPGTAALYLATRYDGTLLGTSQPTSGFYEDLMVIAKLHFAAEPVTASRFTVTVFPNPTADLINVSVTGVHDELLRLELFDTVGRRIRSFPSVTGRNQHRLDLIDLTAGVYMLRVQGEGSTKMLPVVKH